MILTFQTSHRLTILCMHPDGAAEMKHIVGVALAEAHATILDTI